MLIFVGSLLWWQQDAAGGNKNGEASRKTAKKVGIFHFENSMNTSKWGGAGIKIQIWLFEKLAAWRAVGFETRVNDGTC